MLEKDLVLDLQKKKEIINTCLSHWGKEHYRLFPWRDNRTPYSILIAEVLLKRTTASAVKNVFTEFMLTYPNVSILAKADCWALETNLRKLGYHKVRARILTEMAIFIIEKHNGEIPNCKEELLAIPHVGNYTANAILSFSFGEKSAIVDTNVERILRRVFLNHTPKGTSLKPFQEIADTLAPKQGTDFHNYALLDLGGLICTSGLPRCNLCPINIVCDYFLLGNPNRKNAPTTTMKPE